jgi:hypothetical protein
MSGKQSYAGKSRKQEKNEASAPINSMRSGTDGMQAQGGYPAEARSVVIKHEPNPQQFPPQSYYSPSGAGFADQSDAAAPSKNSKRYGYHACLDDC